MPRLAAVPRFGARTRQLELHATCAPAGGSRLAQLVPDARVAGSARAHSLELLDEFELVLQDEFELVLLDDPESELLDEFELVLLEPLELEPLADLRWHQS